MKSSKMLFLSLISAFFLFGHTMLLSSCGDDDDKPFSNNLIGTWQVDKVNLSGKIAGIDVNEEVNPSGTITFNSDFTGKENYQYTIPSVNIPVFENDNFTWSSSGNQLTIDPGDVDQQDWSRTINESKSQAGSYQIVDGATNYTVTINLSK